MLRKVTKDSVRNNTYLRFYDGSDVQILGQLASLGEYKDILV
jgi:hypothetical protein